jgi:sugar lactone lactonase YvrE
MIVPHSTSALYGVSRAVLFLFFLAVIVSCDDNEDARSPDEFSLVSTLAGSETPGLVDGIGSLAKFNYPCGMVVDTEGNVFVADHANHSIRKITPRGVVTTYAGTGKPGEANGHRLSATFNNPYGLALDAEGNLYVGDVANHRIRKIAVDGTVTTLAGKKRGFSDNKGLQAKFNHPYGITVDSRNNVYVADSYNHRIRKIAPDGWVTTVAGNGNDGYVDGSGTAAEFYVPIGIEIDAEGNIYVGDEGNSSIRRITPGGHVTTLAGNGKFSFADGVGREATFNAPGAIALDKKGNLYVADYLNNCIRRLTPGGEVRKIAGNLKKGFADGLPSIAQFYYPFGIAVDPSGVIYVGDHFNHRIRKIN